MSTNLKLSIFFIVVILITLGLSPLVDQRWALLPYDNLTHKFYGETHLWCKIVYYAVNLMTALLIIIPFALFLRSFKRGYRGDKCLIQRMILISYLSLAIGPGLLVNTLFKDNWGRARPYQVIRDGHPFSLPWQPHWHRPADNSFPCGHVSIGAFIGIPLLAARRKTHGLVLCGIGFAVVGLVRFLQGGHYFSDIIIASALVWLVSSWVTAIVDRFFGQGKLK